MRFLGVDLDLWGVLWMVKKWKEMQGTVSADSLGFQTPQGASLGFTDV